MHMKCLFVTHNHSFYKAYNSDQFVRHYLKRSWCPQLIIKYGHKILYKPNMSINRKINQVISSSTKIWVQTCLYCFKKKCRSYYFDYMKDYRNQELEYLFKHKWEINPQLKNS